MLVFVFWAAEQTSPAPRLSFRMVPGAGSHRYPLPYRTLELCLGEHRRACRNSVTGRYRFALFSGTAFQIWNSLLPFRCDGLRAALAPV